jgi:hypothetical protein
MNADKSSTNAASDAVRKVLRLHPEGLSALKLANNTVELGFSQRVVEQEIRRAIDDGTVKVGGNLELRLTSEHA